MEFFSRVEKAYLHTKHIHTHIRTFSILITYQFLFRNEEKYIHKLTFESNTLIYGFYKCINACSLLICIYTINKSVWVIWKLKQFHKLQLEMKRRGSFETLIAVSLSYVCVYMIFFLNLKCCYRILIPVSNFFRFHVTNSSFFCVALHLYWCINMLRFAIRYT